MVMPRSKKMDMETLELGEAEREQDNDNYNHTISVRPIVIPAPHTLYLGPNYVLEAKLAGMQLCDDDDTGERFEIVTNFLRPHIQKTVGIYKYFLKFTPMLVNPEKKLQAIAELLWELRLDVDVKDREREGDLWLLNEDRNTLYTKSPLECKTYAGRTIIADTGDPEQEITVDIEFLLPVKPFDSYEFTRDFMETLLKEAMVWLDYGKSNQWIFHSVNEKQILELPRNLNLETNPGYKIGMRQTDIGPLFWLDIFFLTKRQEGLYESPLLNKEKFIIGRIITCDINNLFYKVDEIIWSWNPNTKLPWAWVGEKEFQEFGQVSYAEFLFKQYGIQVKHLNQPLILTKWNKSEFLMIPKSFTIAKNNDLFYVNIPEFCRLSGWKEQCKRDPLLLEKISETVNVDPEPRMVSLKNLVEKFGEEHVKQLFGSWGLKLDTELFALNAKTLNGPILTFGDDLKLYITNTIYPDRMFKELAFKGCYSNVKIKRWIFVYPILSWKNAALPLQQHFMDASKEIGNIIHDPYEISCVQSTEENFVAAIEDKLNSLEKQVKFALILLPKPEKSKGNVYDGVKKLLLLKFGIPSQCIKLRSWVESGPEERKGIARKLALQVNAKMGGALWNVEMPYYAGETMFIGIDAYHNIPKKHSSVYAVAYSLNPNMTKFYTRVKIQQTGQEIGDDLVPMTFDALNAYAKERKRYPDNIVVFRDGVSNAYFDLVKDHEVKQIKEAFGQIDDCYRPNLLFTIIQKHTTDRMYVQEKGEFTNPVPGTVVDELITRTKFRDFFLWSQLYRGRGSGMPVRVTIIESSEDVLSSYNFDMAQNLAYGASFAYYNWTGSIRVPAPLQYAHAAAGLVGKHLKKPPLASLEKTLYYL